MPTKSIGSLTYRQWQQRNTEHYNRLSRQRQLQIRKSGYKNSGWEEVQKSWQLIQKIESTPDTYTLLTLRREALLRDKTLSSEEFSEGLFSLFTDSLNHTRQVLQRSQDRRYRIAKLKEK